MKGDRWRDHEGRHMKGDKAAAAAKSSQNGDHEGRQMKGDKAAAATKSTPEWKSWRGANEGRQGGSQEQPRMEIMNWRQMKGDKAAAAAKSNPEWKSWRETKEVIEVLTSQWLGCWSPKSQNARDAAAALSPFICLTSWSPFWAALGCRCRLVSLHLSPFMIGCSWLPLPPCLPSFISLHDLHSGLLLASRAFCDFGDQQPSHWEVRTPIASSYLGKKRR